ncbi:15924_t:CDS:1, partial [Acaulospora colombiana]
MEENNENLVLVQRPNRGELLTYRAQEAPPDQHTGETLPPDDLEKFPLLPRKKLRALVSLYHQSSTFITPETLDRHIEKEFALDPRRPVHLDQALLKKEA